MAGHPRTRGDRAATRRAGRPQRRRERMAVRYAQAATAAARLEIAHDYVRGAAARRQPDPARTAAVLDELARALIAAGDGLLAAQAREPRHPTTTTTEEVR